MELTAPQASVSLEKENAKKEIGQNIVIVVGGYFAIIGLIATGFITIFAIAFWPASAMETSDPYFSALNALKDIAAAFVAIGAFIGAGIIRYILGDYLQ